MNTHDLLAFLIGLIGVASGINAFLFKQLFKRLDIVQAMVHKLAEDIPLHYQRQERCDERSKEIKGTLSSATDKITNLEVKVARLNSCKPQTANAKGRG